MFKHEYEQHKCSVSFVLHISKAKLLEVETAAWQRVRKRKASQTRMLSGRVCFHSHFTLCLFYGLTLHRVLMLNKSVCVEFEPVFCRHEQWGGNGSHHTLIKWWDRAKNICLRFTSSWKYEATVFPRYASTPTLSMSRVRTETQRSVKHFPPQTHESTYPRYDHTCT